MNNTNDTTPRRDAQEDVIELGVASVETKGTSEQRTIDTRHYPPHVEE
ncbi:hypothetical protein [Xanthomonas hortorum]